MRFKRILALLLTLLILLTACGSYDNGSEGFQTKPQDQTSEVNIETQPAESPEQIPETATDTSPPAPQEETSETTADTATATTADTSQEEISDVTVQDNEPEADLPEYGEYYYDVVNVVLYLEMYGELPPNYITKNEARELGWSGGSVEDYLEDAAIGGDYFGNYEGLLPKAAGRSYTECDIDTHGYHSRGSRRLIFSSDGLYFYTSDHYESFSEITVTEDNEVIW